MRGFGVSGDSVERDEDTVDGMERERQGNE
jgi:hypothetical protein